MRTDPVYRANQRQSQKIWGEVHQGYWTQYRAEHPGNAERNRLHRLHKFINMAPIAKMDALEQERSSSRSSYYGQSWLVPDIAKMDAIKVNLYLITGHWQ